MATTLPFLSKSVETTNADIKSVCVFCGSGSGADPLYEQEAYGNLSCSTEYLFTMKKS